MKKLLFIITAALIFSFSAKSQSNMGIIVGGGVSDMRIKTDEPEFDKELNTEELNFRLMYQGGLSFENVLVERQLYLQFGLHAKSAGYSSHNDSIGMSLHNIHIPVEMKYKHFFDRRGENYMYASVGPYISATFYGLKYDLESVDRILDNPKSNYEMDNPRVEMGKTGTADIMAFDYGVNAGFGFGFSNFQIGYNYGMGIANMIPSAWLEPIDGEEEYTFILRNGYHSVTLGYFFSNK